MGANRGDFIYGHNAVVGKFAAPPIGMLCPDEYRVSPFGLARFAAEEFITL
jgi:hypothetical protein